MEVKRKQEEEERKKREDDEKRIQVCTDQTVELNFYQNRIYKIIKQKKGKQDLDLLDKLSLVYLRDEKQFLKWLWDFRVRDMS